MCDGRDDDFDSGCGIKNTVTIDTDRHRGAEKRSGGILAGGDFRQEIQPVPLELFSRKTLAQRRGKRLLSPPAQRRVKFGRGQGALFKGLSLPGSYPQIAGAAPLREHPNAAREAASGTPLGEPTALCSPSGMKVS